MTQTEKTDMAARQYARRDGFNSEEVGTMNIYFVGKSDLYVSHEVDILLWLARQLPALIVALDASPALRIIYRLCLQHLQPISHAQASSESRSLIFRGLRTTFRLTLN